MPQITNEEIIWAFEKAAAVLSIHHGSVFQIRAYQHAIETIQHLDQEITNLYQNQQLPHLSGIGVQLTQKIIDLVTTGVSPSLEKMYDTVPAGTFALLKVPGIGPKKAYRLAQAFHLDNEADAISKLKTALVHHQIQLLPGFGEKSEQDIASNLSRLRPKSQRLRIDQADSLASSLLTTLRSIPEVITASALGSLRRRQDTVGDIDIGIATDDVKAVVEALTTKLPEIKVQISGNNVIRCIIPINKQADIKFQTPEKFGATLQHFTGSKLHNIALRELALKQGKSLSEHGIKSGRKVKTFSHENDFYHDLGLPYIPPEIRENQGEIELALKHQLPQLVKHSQLRGEFHTHTNYPMVSSHDHGDAVFSLLNAAYELHYEWIVLGDHNPSRKTYDPIEMIRVIRQRNAWIDQSVHQWNMSNNNIQINVLKGLEVDIMKNGTLSVPNNALDLLDVVLISIHSSFSLSSSQQTLRYLTSLSHPNVNIIAHPTGRINGKRIGMEADWEKIMKMCVVKGVALEVNASPDRLDLPDSLVRLAVSLGVKLALGSDAHDATRLAAITYGVDVARRGWARRADVLNTYAVTKLKAWLARK